MTKQISNQYPRLDSRFSDIATTFDRLNAFVDGIFSSHSTSLSTGGTFLSLQNKDNSYIVKYWIPAARKDQFDVGVKSGILEVIWDVLKEDVDSAGYLSHSVRPGNYRFQIKLPDNLTEHPEIEYKDEILTIVMKTNDKKQTKIQVK